MKLRESLQRMRAVCPYCLIRPFATGRHQVACEKRMTRKQVSKRLKE